MKLKTVVRPKISDDPFTCEHGNEAPNYCPCPPTCYCKSRTCKGTPSLKSLEKQSTTLEIIRSGFQIGVDIAGIRAARKVGLKTTGAMPIGFLTREGLKPEYKKLGAYEIPTKMGSTGYATRTEANVVESDGTIIIAYNWRSPGTVCTIRALNKHRKTVFNVDVADIKNEDKKRMLVYNVCEWIKREKIRDLNIAGNGDPELEVFVEDFLADVFEKLGVGK